MNARGSWLARIQTASLVLPISIIMLAGFIGPIGIVAWTSITEAGKIRGTAYFQLFESSTFLGIAARTVWVATTVTLLSLSLGYPTAYLLATRLGRFSKVAMALVIVPYLTSVLIRSYSWIVILGNNGVVNKVLITAGLVESPVALVFNRVGAYVGMVHIMLPLMILPIYASLAQIDRSSRMAAESLGAHPVVVFVTVTAPLSAPGVLAGTVLVFLASLGFYITPSMLGAPGDYLIAQAIEVRISTLGEFDTAAAIACTLVVVVAALLLLLRNVIIPVPEIVHHQSQRQIPSRYVQDILARLVDSEAAAVGMPVLDWLGGKVLWSVGLATPAFLVAPLFIIVAIAFSSAPYLSFPPPSFSWRWFSAFLQDERWTDSTIFSVGVSALSAGTALIAGGLLARAVVRDGSAGRKALWIIAVSPLILPQIVLGYGQFLTLLFLGLNGRWEGFWIAYAVIGVPYVLIIVAPAIAKLDPGLERAAASLGGSPFVTWRTILLPLLSVSLLSAFVFAFLAAFDDLVIALFLSSPEYTPLSMRMWEDIRLEISPKTAVIGTLQLTLLALGLIGEAILNRKRRT